MRSIRSSPRGATVRGGAPACAVARAVVRSATVPRLNSVLPSESSAARKAAERRARACRRCGGREIPVLLRAALLTLTASTLPLGCRGGNWAQPTGPKSQNTGIPTTAKFSARFGHAMVMMPGSALTPDEATDDNGDGIVTGAERSTAPDPSLMYKIFVLGGDSYSPRDQKGGLQNDIWWTTGASWQTVLNEVEMSTAGEFEVRLVSRAWWKEEAPTYDSSWTRTADRPYATYRNLRYDDWIACAPVFATNANFQPWYGVCPDMAAGVSRRWSPRRGHAALVHTDFTNVDDTRWERELFVLGGTMRDQADLADTWPDEHGGWVNNGGRKSNVHEHLIETNDIWVSRDGFGSAWSLVNPGCKVHPLGGYGANRTGLADGPLVDGRVVHDWNTTEGSQYRGGFYYSWRGYSSSDPYYGRMQDRCLVDTDCKGYAKCDTALRTCVCLMWSPRERHAVASYKIGEGDPSAPDQVTLPDGTPLLKGTTTWIVSGGATTVESRYCGWYMCNTLGGASKRVLNDVWRSNDRGASWSLVVAQAPWAPRAGHNLIRSGGVLYLLAGSGGSFRNASENNYYADVWQSADIDGAGWLPVFGPPEIGAEFGMPGWSARSDAVAVEINDEVLITGGTAETGALGDTWWWHPWNMSKCVDLAHLAA